MADNNKKPEEVSPAVANAVYMASDYCRELATVVAGEFSDEEAREFYVVLIKGLEGAIKVYDNGK